MKSASSWFEIEGGDMNYYVVWDLYGDDLTVDVYLEGTFKTNVTKFLFDDMLQKIYDVAEDESLELVP